MTRLQAVGLCVVAACLGFAWPADAAGKYDGSAPMLCAVTAVSECTADGNCQRSAPQAGNNFPTFMRVDLAGKVLRADDGSGRKTDIRASSIVDDQLMLQGIENGKAWSMVIKSDTGRWRIRGVPSSL